MGFFKGLSIVTAVVAAPFTGGTSLLLVAGAVAPVVAAGYAGKKIYEKTTEGSREAEKAREEAEKNKAGWQQSEEKRQREAAAHEADMKRMNENLEKLMKERSGMLEELRKNKFTENEIEIMFTLAAAAAQCDGVTTNDEIQSASKAISLLCTQPENAINIGKKIFAQIITIDDAMKKVRLCQDANTIRRLGFILDMVVYADGYIDVKEQELLDAFNEHACSFGVTV